MKTQHLFISLLFASLFLFACKAQRYNPNQLPNRQLLFGKGGGFAGEMTEYILLDNGQLFKRSGVQNTLIELGQIKKKETKQLLKEVKALELEKKQVDEPGNMYYFICLKDGDQEHRVTWGSPTYQVDSTVQAFHKKMLEVVKNTDAPEK